MSQSGKCARHCIGILTFGLTAAPTACSSGHGNDEPVATASFAIASVPDEVHCIEIAVEGSRSVRTQFDVEPEATSLFEVSGLPVGPVVVSGSAFNVPCAQTPGAEPSWASEPLDVLLRPGPKNQIVLALFPRVKAEVVVDFQGGIPTSGNVCGNNVVEAPEICDGTDLNGRTCLTLGFAGGSLACNASCNLDSSGCSTTSICGDGLVAFDERCDGTDLNGFTCTDFGYIGGTLSCDPSTCLFDVSACTQPVCGDNLAEGSEICDGTDLKGRTCLTLGYSSGTLTCDSTCNLDTSGCSTVPVCGDNVAVQPELCDGQDLQGRNCTHFGFAGGTLACDTNCQYDTSSCN